jgi:probable phosphoglycerate mutase
MRQGEPTEVVLVRHGETSWSRLGRHTGRTDIPLTARGRRDAEAAGAELAGLGFALVLTSPLARAADTCRLAGYGPVAQVRDDLVEWDYGAYEGRTTSEVRAEVPGWTIWDGEVPDGETLAEVGVRADRLLVEFRAVAGNVLVFSHGHVLRVLAARWLGLEPRAGALFALDPATISVLGYEHERAVIRAWNDLCVP